MKKISLLLALSGLLFPMGIMAAPLTPEQALQRSSAFSGKRMAASNSRAPELVYTAKALNGVATSYVFNHGNGYMILSADDIAYPVLGYSDNGTFDEKNIPPQLEWWMQEYSRQIEYAAANNLNVQPDTPESLVDPSWEAITPMLKTKWDQGTPYNNQCPSINNIPCPTGCVAVSMAQVMNYFKYPEVGKGSVNYTIQGIGSLALNFSRQPFDWDNMLDVYVAGGYNEAQADAVAYLMKAVGYSVHMGYGPMESGAVSNYIISAMIDNFQYDEGIRYEGRELYSTTEWVKMIYDNLKNVGPVIYDGTDIQGGGHSFVCDGYDGKGYFHFNWGWSGVSDGYYTLNALNPQALGTGGGNGGGFNFDQDVCLGIQKPTGATYPAQKAFLSTTGAIKLDEFSGNTLKIGQQGNLHLGWMNDTQLTLNAYIGVGIANVNGGDTIYVQGKLGSMANLNLRGGTYYPYILENGTTNPVIVDLPATLDYGKYTATVVTKERSSANAPWIPIETPYAFPNYVNIEKTSQGITASSQEIPITKIEGFEILNDIYFNRKVITDIDLVNDTDFELTYGYALYLLNDDGSVAFTGVPALVTVFPNSSLSTSFSSTLNRASGTPIVREPTEYTVAIYNETLGMIQETYGKVIMEPNPGAATLKMSVFEIEGYERVREEVNGRNQWIFNLPEVESVNVDMTLSVTSGYFDSQFQLALNRMSPYDPNQQITVIDQLLAEQLFLTSGEEVSYQVPLSITELEVGVYYYLVAEYVNNNTYTTITSILFRIGESGVEIIETTEGIEPEYYNLQGIRVINPVKGQILIEKTGNITRKIKY